MLPLSCLYVYHGMMLTLCSTNMTSEHLLSANLTTRRRVARGGRSPKKMPKKKREGKRERGREREREGGGGESAPPKKILATRLTTREYVFEPPNAKN